MALLIYNKKGYIHETHRDIICIRSIPYAKRPVGNLRWMAPVLERDLTSYPRSLNETNSDGKNIYQTKEKAPACPSAFEFGNSTTEDCLYIDLFVPRKAIEEKLALNIFFYFHGGAFLAGTNVVVGRDRGAFIGNFPDDLFC